ncbi:GlsB/YeaQ/YmgE family stress response membrane protein [Paenisporosarcina cavernae]|uniref:GlsB/YeaQ/YmgE family stress response membrane protein n=1 Tax=Paenisporosarcina cavernae TaxID=2320858 RepID=A0A385YT43_9BACL|nr:GlsB/YeaQ/YmgE family stress response membrane protein [Paenisporosarcina cavernae]AYC29490.1 GlsB/YeaQ/YmgE family stress response membrane protein [Paenisporosarcina cavernae]
MAFILYLIIGGIIGWLAGLLLGKDLPGGIIGNIIAGIIGAWIGGSLFGDFGPSLWGMAIIPALLGAIILVFIVSLILRALRK